MHNMKKDVDSPCTTDAVRSRHGSYRLVRAAVIAWGLGCGPALADEFQDLAHVIEVVSEFALQAGSSRSAQTGGVFKVEVGALDARLHLAPCDAKLTTFMPPGARTLGNTTVGVQCSGTRPWSLYVPVSIKMFGEAVVAVRPLAGGTALTPQDVHMAQVELGTASAGALTDPQQVAGKVLRRPLLADAVVTADSLEEPRMVRRDERVTLVAEGSGIEVRMMGQALADGVLGELIKVRNLGSKRVVEGTVLSAGLIRVRM